MEITHFALTDEQTHANYFANMNPGDYTITLTLNPKMYSADIITQYRLALKEIVQSKVFMDKHHKEKKWTNDPDFDFMYLVPELTADYNIHFHGYFRCNPEKAHIFIDRFKALCYNNEVLGRQHKVSCVDDLYKLIIHDIPHPKTATTQESLEQYRWKGKINEYALKEIDLRTSKCNNAHKLFITKFKQIV